MRAVSPMEDNIIIEAISANTLDGCWSLLKRPCTPIAGVHSHLHLKYLCQDALLTQDVVILLAQKQQSILGCVVAIIDYHHYWKRFLLKHPVLLARILFSRVKRYFQDLFQSQKDANHKGESLQVSLNISDKEQKTQNDMKVFVITVEPEHRNKGIASKLYQALIQKCRELQITKIDASIHQNNQASIRLHKNIGFTLASPMNESW